MKDKIIEELKKVYDPEMPSIDVFNLGLIYDIDIKEENVTITHTLTSMLCPMADQIQKDIKEAVERVAGEGNVKVILTQIKGKQTIIRQQEAEAVDKYMYGRQDSIIRISTGTILFNRRLHRC